LYGPGVRDPNPYLQKRGVGGQGTNVHCPWDFLKIDNPMSKIVYGVHRRGAGVDLGGSGVC